MYIAKASVKGLDYDYNQGDKITDEQFKKVIDRHKPKFAKVDEKTLETPKAEAEKPQTTGVKK